MKLSLLGLKFVSLIRKQKTLSVTFPVNRLKIEVEVTNHYKPPYFQAGIHKEFWDFTKKSYQKGSISG